jgi:hypothetical protein
MSDTPTPIPTEKTENIQVYLDGEELNGVLSVYFKITRTEDYPTSTERIPSTNKAECTLQIKPLNTYLDELLYKPVPTPCHIAIILKEGNELIKQIFFDECYVKDKSFEIDSSEVGVTTYHLTSPRPREE